MRASLLRRVVALSFCAWATLASNCGAGDGSGGGPPVAEVGPVCLDGGIALSGAFPSGFDLLPDGNGAVVQGTPPAVLGLDLSETPLTLLATGAIPPLFPGGDSDGDGRSDGLASNAAGFGFRTPLPGRLTAIGQRLSLLSTTNYEGVAFVDPHTGESVELRVETPPSFTVGQWPFLPPPGTSALRTALSTRVCIELPGAVDSLGDLVGADSRCPPTPSGVSFVTSLTAGSALAGEAVFVATSNLTNSAQSRFDPGTVLVFEIDLLATPPLVRPHAVAPVLFTTGFNATQVTPYENRDGRELVLVTLTGAIGAGTGADNILGAAAVDVVDVASMRVVATIPLGPAGPSFEPIAIDATRRVGLLGSTSEKVLFAIDLAPLDEERLYALGAGPPVVLDGTDPVFGDARIATADSPIRLLDRADGPPVTDCAGYTSVATDVSGGFAYATDFCDGTLTTLLLDTAPAPAPLPADRISVLGNADLYAPNVPGSLTRLRAPGAVRVRPTLGGEPRGGPDAVIVSGLPEGAVCPLDLGL